MEGSASSSRRRLNRAMLGIVGLVLLAMVGLSYRQWEQYRHANAEAERSRKILPAIDSVLVNLVDAETGQRGFLLTADSRYLEPYNRAVQELPNELATLKELSSSSQRGIQGFDELDALTNRKLHELRQTIELRRTQGAQAALAIVLTDEGKRTMDSIRAHCAQMRREENAIQAQASAAREEATGIVLLLTVAGSLTLLFLFAFGFEPFASSEPQAWQRPWLARYGAAVLAVVAVALLRGALTPLVGITSIPFTLFFCAVIFAAWFGGFRPAVLSIVLSLLAGDWFFAAPTGSLLVSGRDDEVAMLLLILVGFGAALLSRSQRGAVDRALRAENSERHERQRFETTLAGIGDAVIATDAKGCVTFANEVALSLVHWTEAEVNGKPIDVVFRIVNEFTRAAVESPVARALREGAIVGLANHTILIARDGTEVQIDDSAAPIRDAQGKMTGVVLVFRDITERRKAEAISQLFSSIVESSEDAIITKDANGIITSWNRGAEHVFGYSANEMIGKPITMLAPQDRRDEMRQTLERIRHGERVQHYRAVRQTKSGTLIHVSVSVSPIQDAGGRIVGASKIARDISEQVEAQRELAVERGRLGGIIDSAMDAIVTVDESQRIKVFNHAAEQVFQCPTSDALDQSLETFIPERFRQAHRNHIQHFGTSGATSRSMSRPGALWGLRKDGEEFPLEGSISQIESGGERLFTVILRDITERKRIEDELHRERERLGIALTAGQMGVYEVNPANGMLWWASETYSLFGVKPKEFEPTRDSFAGLIHAPDRDQFMEYWDENIAQRQPINHEFRVLQPDGSVRWISCRGMTRYDDAGSPIRNSGVFVDITERKNAEQVLRQWEKLSAAARLSAALAHEINNPLAAVVNLVYLAKGAPGVPPSIAEQLEVAEQELERVAHAARQALGFYREQAAAERIDVPALITSVLKIFSTKIAAKKILIERRFEKCRAVHGVRGELRQVVSNLIANAIDAVSEEGVITVGVRPLATDKESVVEITIADNGPGVSAQHIDRLFEPFFTTKAGTGTGLGLWVTKEIIERHGGTIALISENGELRTHGATFTVTIPTASATS